MYRISELCDASILRVDGAGGDGSGGVDERITAFSETSVHLYQTARHHIPCRQCG